MKVALLISGGVDSSVALHRLLQSGEHDVVAFYLKVWLEDELAFLGECPWEDDLHFARSVCKEAGVALEVVSLQREYHERVVASALHELRSGLTPSPDVLCNRRIKFGAFFEQLAPEFDAIASGHYARKAWAGERPVLERALDGFKDQTYFLADITEDQLSRCLFPLGDLSKTEVREEAARLRLANRERPDSQGICFLGRISYRDFLRARLGEDPGDIVEAGTERRLGLHRGHWFHTLGQRRGLGLSGGPWFVIAKDPARNRIEVVHGSLLESHARDRFVVPRPHWISLPPGSQDLEVKIRHGEKLISCHIEGSDSLAVELAESDPGLAPGQWAVFYEGNRCLGGGPILLSPAPS